MAMNGKQRSHWLSDMIAETQRYLSKTKNSPEAPLVQKTLNLLDEARKMAADDDSDAVPN
jgi:hypothetical protein